ncbi:carotenoid cleavage dioxygenase 7 [Corchorus olitorius]|uniref:Carotenoid cleavage dioxygenase 7 n=1 Tax=Corchorus olitorius TaxID=93759 RepID=A0A1R3GH87_9ROSI|nr:carotenoid cleavage dioxygenase 7 [Corchorus olitorius]
MAQKRATPVDGAKLKKQKSHDLNDLPLKLIEPDVLVTTPSLQIIKPTSEVLVSQEAKAYLAGVNSLSYSPNYSPEQMVNSEIIQDSAQVTIFLGLSPSIFLNDEEMVDIYELLASSQLDGVVADMWKDIDDVYLSNNPRELGTELIPDPSINLVACNVNGSSWGAIITYPAPKCHALTMPIL